MIQYWNAKYHIDGCRTLAGVVTSKHVIRTLLLFCTMILTRRLSLLVQRSQQLVAVLVCTPEHASTHVNP